MIKDKGFKKLVVGLMVAVMLVPMAVSAAEINDDALNIEKKSFKKEQVHEVHNNRGESKNYILDLVEKYAPDTLDNWTELTEDMKEAREEMREERAEEMLEARIKNHEDIKSKLEEIKSKLESGEITKKEVLEEMKNVRIENSIGKDIRENRDLNDDKKEDMKAFREAVKNGDEDTIKELLAEKYELLKEKLNNMKTNE